MGDCAFYGCLGLVELGFQKGSQLERIGYGAFLHTQLSAGFVRVPLGAVVAESAFSEGESGEDVWL